MALLSTTGKIFLVLEPISGRFGIPRLLAKLSSNSLNINPIQNIVSGIVFFYGKTCLIERDFL